MSNRDPDDRYEALPQALPFFGDQLLKRVHTCIPGVVKEYDHITRRARVQPAVDLLLTDGTTLEKPIILDVPVIFPAGGGYTVHFPLIPDDPVMLFFSERDIANFKEKLEVGPPLSADIMAIQHAVCIPGFVAPDVALAGNGLVLQTNDGTTYVHVLDGRAEVVTDGDAIVTAAGMATVTAPDVHVVGNVTVYGNMAVYGRVDLPYGTYIDGLDYATHEHYGVSTGTGWTMHVSPIVVRPNPVSLAMPNTTTTVARNDNDITWPMATGGAIGQDAMYVGVFDSLGVFLFSSQLTNDSAAMALNEILYIAANGMEITQTTGGTELNGNTSWAIYTGDPGPNGTSNESVLARVSVNGNDFTITDN